MSRPEIPEPIPPSNKRTKKWSITELVRHEGEWKFEKTNHIRHYDMILRKWIEDKSQITKEYLSLESQGTKKVHRLDLLLQRTAFDSHLREISAWFKITVECRVPEAPEFEHWYLKVVKSHQTKRKWCKGCFVLNDLALGTAQTMSWTHRWIKRVGEEIKLTQEQASKLIEAGEIADIVEEDPKKPDQFSSQKCISYKVL